MSRENISELIIKLYDELSAPARAAAASIKGLTSDFQRSQNALESWSRQVKRGMADAEKSILKTALAAGALYVAMSGPIKRASELAESMKTLQINTNRSEEGMARLQDRFQGLARSLNMDMKQLSDGANLLPKAIKDNDAALEKALGTVGRFSRAMNSDFAASLRTVRPLMGELKIAAEDLPRAFDLLAKAQRRFNVPVEAIMENLPRMAEEMDSLGMRGTRGLGQALSVISAITERTGDASAAMSAFTRIMEKGFSEKVLKQTGVQAAFIMQDANKRGANPVRAIMEAIAERVQYLPNEGMQKKVLQDIFGPRFAIGARSMIEMLKTIDKTTREVFDSQGEIDKAFKIRMADWTESWRALTNELGVFQDVMGGVLGNALRPYVDMLHSATIWITNFTKAHPGLVGWLAKASIGLTALSLVLSVIRLAFWGGAGIIAAFTGAAVTAGGLIALLPALAAGFVTAAAAFFLFKGSMKAWGYMKDFASGVGNVMGAIFGISSAHAATNNMAVPDAVRHPLSAIQDHTQETVNVITQLDHTIRMRVAPFWYGTAAGRGFGGSSGPGGGGGGGSGGGSGYGGSGSGGGGGGGSGGSGRAGGGTAPGGSGRGGGAGSGSGLGGSTGGAGGAYPVSTYSGPNSNILATIRQRESRGNYSQHGTHSATGAYQFIGSTWRGLTKQSGIGQQYDEAWKAPPEVQDQVAGFYVQDILKRHNNDVSWVPREWFGGPKGYLTPAEQAANPGVTMNGYIKGWMADLGKQKGGEVQQAAGGGGYAGMGGSAADKLMAMTGLHEVRNRDIIRRFLADGGHGMDPATTAWCAAAVGSALHQSGYRDIPGGPGGGDWVPNWQKWGRQVNTAAERVQKDDVFMHWGGSRYSHIGLATGDADPKTGRIKVVEGNTSDEVKQVWVDPRSGMVRRATEREAPIKSAMKGRSLQSSLSGIHAQPYIDDTHLDDAIEKAERLHSLLKMNNPSSFKGNVHNEHSIYRNQNHRLMSAATQGS